MKFAIFLVSCLLFVISEAAKLPSTFKTCDKSKSDFNDCLFKAITDAVIQLTKPIKELGITSLDPLEIPSLVIGAGKRAVDVQQIYNNMTVTGLTKMTCSKAGFDPSSNVMNLKCEFPEIIMAFEYDFKGNILLLPIVGKGPGSITLRNVSGDLTAHLSEFDKNGKKYYKLDSSTLTFKPSLMIFKFDNLFDGDKAVGDNINKVLNDNWKEIYDDIGASYENAFNTIFASILKNILGKVSAADLFGRE